MPTLRRTVLIASSTMLTLGACSGSDGGDGGDDPASIADFCATYAELIVEQPESYVGSAENLADIEQLLAATPEPARDDLAVYRDYVASGVIDAESDPDSTLTADFPGDVRAAITAVQQFEADNC